MCSRRFHLLRRQRNIRKLAHGVLHEQLSLECYEFLVIISVQNNKVTSLWTWINAYKRKIKGINVGIVISRDIKTLINTYIVAERN